MVQTGVERQQMRFILSQFGEMISATVARAARVGVCQALEEFETTLTSIISSNS